MIIETFNKEEWKGLAEEAHRLCFGESRPNSVDRIDFALMAVEGKDPVSYMTVREVDSEAVYVQYGGSFRPGTIHSLRSYSLLLNSLKEKGYSRATTYIENTNKVMLKFAMKMGWFITGLKNHDGSILLEHTIKFGEMNV